MGYFVIRNRLRKAPRIFFFIDPMDKPVLIWFGSVYFFKKVFFFKVLLWGSNNLQRTNACVRFSTVRRLHFFIFSTSLFSVHHYCVLHGANLVKTFSFGARFFVNKKQSKNNAESVKKEVFLGLYCT